MNPNLAKFGKPKTKKTSYDVFVKEKGPKRFTVYVKNLDTKEVDYSKCTDAVSEKQAGFFRDMISKNLSKKGHFVKNDKTIYQ